jgi:hypothetical protein
LLNGICGKNMKNWILENARSYANKLLVFGLFWIFGWAVGLRFYLEYPGFFEYLLSLQGFINIHSLLKSVLIGFLFFIVSYGLNSLYEIFTRIEMKKRIGGKMNFIVLGIRIFLVFFIVSVFAFFMVMPFVCESNKPVYSDKRVIQRP